jgi:very-short-patch-repair endonuclease
VRGSDRARELRQRQTDAEARLWWYLRVRRLGGFKFRRQCPCGRYIVDFICVERRVVIEIDGGQHATQRKHDQYRATELESLGLSLFRYWNDDVLVRTEAVLQDILARLSAPHPSPLPARGEREL